jgi:dTDP-4-amino-4,6-dideoxygalactose transaminase
MRSGRRRPTPALHRLSEYAARAAEGDLAGTEAAADRHCPLPMWTEMTPEQIADVVAACRAAAGA